MNIIHLLGRLVNDPDFRSTPNGSPYCRFRIAVPRNKEKSDFFNIVAWEKTAEFAEKYFRKGERIIVHGSLRNSDYTDKDGKKQYSFEIVADRLEFADTKAPVASRDAQNPVNPEISDDYRVPEVPPTGVSDDSINPDDYPY